MSSDRSGDGDYHLDWPTSEEPATEGQAPPSKLAWQDVPGTAHPVPADVSRNRRRPVRSPVPAGEDAGAAKVRIRVRDTAASGTEGDVPSEVERLEALVAELRAEIAVLRRRLDER